MTLLFYTDKLAISPFFFIWAVKYSFLQNENVKKNFTFSSIKRKKCGLILLQIPPLQGGPPERSAAKVNCAEKHAVVLNYHQLFVVPCMSQERKRKKELSGSPAKELHCDNLFSSPYHEMPGTLKQGHFWRSSERFKKSSVVRGLYIPHSSKIMSQPIFFQFSG